VETNRRSSGRKGGRPRYSPDPQTRRLVEALAAHGVPQRDIARTVDVSAPTLRKAFRREIDRGISQGNAEIARTLFKMGVSGKHPSVSIFLGKVRLGMKEPPADLDVAVNHTIVRVLMPRKSATVEAWVRDYAPAEPRP
jgi:DNA-binding Lrp family transcriptional regulator